MFGEGWAGLDGLGCLILFPKFMCDRGSVDFDAVRPLNACDQSAEGGASGHLTGSSCSSVLLFCETPICCLSFLKDFRSSLLIFLFF